MKMTSKNVLSIMAAVAIVLATVSADTQSGPIQLFVDSTKCKPPAQVFIYTAECFEQYGKKFDKDPAERDPITVLETIGIGKCVGQKLGFIGEKLPGECAPKFNMDVAQKTLETFDLPPNVREEFQTQLNECLTVPPPCGHVSKRFLFESKPKEDWSQVKECFRSTVINVCS